MGAKVSITMTAAEFDAVRKLIQVGIDQTKEDAKDASTAGRKQDRWDLESLAADGERLLSGPLG